MEFKQSKVQYWGDEFTKYTPFDLVDYTEVINSYSNTAKKLEEKYQKQGRVERPINSDNEELKQDAFWNGFPPVYYNIDVENDGTIMAKADVYSMNMAGLGESWSRFIYITLPYELINKYMTNLHDNDDVSIIRRFVKEVELTVGWEGEEWKEVQDKYDMLYPETSTLTDYFGTYTFIKWRQDFDIKQYISIKKNGLLFPICYNSSKFMLRRGTHRAVLLAMTESDVPIFLQYPEKEQFKVITPNFFGGKELEMHVDVIKKKLNFELI